MRGGTAADEGRRGARYWYFTANELGMEDVAAQIDHLHIVKCAELRTAGAGFVAGPLANGFRRQAAARGAVRRSASGCACCTRHHRKPPNADMSYPLWLTRC